MKKIVLTLVFGFWVSSCLLAQMSGPSSVTTGTSHTYSYSSGGYVMSPQWRLDHGYGSITSQWQSGSTYYATITWNSTGTETLAFLDGLMPLGSMNITITVGVPPSPTAIAATSVTHNTFIANWNASAGATSYRLDVSTVNNFATYVSGFNNLTVNGTNKEVTGLSGNTTYYYRVRAVNSGGTSSNSNTVTTLTAITIPNSAAASQVAGSSFYANWSGITGATSYRLDVSTSSDFSGNFISGYNNLLVNTTGKSVIGLTQKTIHYYRVRACIGAVCSSSSNVIPVDIADQNYVVTTFLQKESFTSDTQIANASIGEKSVITGYFDGLGRPMQTVNMKGSPGMVDLVQPVVYDDYGREHRKYLPFTSYNDGWYKPNEQIINAVTGNYIGIAQPFYSTASDKIADDTRPFSETAFEASPLNRPDKDFGTGENWFTNNKNIKHNYLINVHGTSAGQERIIAWEISGNLPVRATTLANYIETGGYYSTGHLNIKSTKDEQGNEVREYTDKLGRVILKKVQAVSSATLSSHNHWAHTYYVYDTQGNLRFVLPPELSSLIYQDTPTNPTTPYLDNLAFQYSYDSKNRMITKKVPGSGIVYMVYDNRDRLVLTQDANQRSVNKWTFTKFDAMNRPVLTGIYTVNTTLTLMQGAVNTYYNNLTASQAWYETYTGTGIFGYNNYSFPQVTNSNEYLTVNYYDNYDFRSSWPITYTYLDESLSEASIPNDTIYTQQTVENVRVMGKVTGTMTKVLDGGITGGYTWLKSVNYYDDNYRVVQTVADNYKGGTDRVTNVMDFVGKVLQSKSTHIENDIVWKDLVGSNLMGNRLYRMATSNNWTGSGAVSAQQLAAGQSGWMEVVVSEINTNRMIGLADTNPNLNYTSIDYAFYLNTSSLKVYENGTLKATISGALVPGEVLRIERSGTTIQYKRNGNVVYTSVTASSSLLFVDASLNTYNATPTLSSSLVGVRSSFSGSTRNIIRRFEYDHAGRLLKVWHKLDGNDDILLAYNEYNELGQLVDKKLHSTVSNGSDAKQSVDHRYNIRGWLTKINESDINIGYSDPSNSGEARDFFGMQLAYNNTDLGISNTAQYNGNISAIAWSNNQSLGTNKQNGFVYSYDPMNRLTIGTHKLSATAGIWTSGQYEESISSYDLNGNIYALQRKGVGGAQIDNLTYYYGAGTTLSNKLLYVQDNTTNTADRAKGFVDGNIGTATDYKYDENGNMDHDLNKGIGTSLSDATNLITYNFLNLPETVTKGANSIRYIYDAGGRKLAQVTSFGTQQKRVDYAGEFQYENDVLQFINHEEGRIANAGTKSIYLHSGDAVTGITAATSTLALVTPANGENYVRATSVGTTAKQGMFPIGGTFTVQGGEQYRIRAKGYRTGANAVHLYIRTNSTDLNWPGATLQNGVTAEANAEQIITVPTGHTTLQAGVVWNTVTAGQQFFLNDFEITKLTVNAAPEYQYNLKDHLGNVRVTFTTKDETVNETATLEDANLNVEQSQFLRIANAKRINSILFDRTNGSSTGYSERLNGSANEKYGIAKSLSVMPGDGINAEVYAKYADTDSANWTGVLSTLMSQIAANTAGVVVDGATYSTSTSSFPAGFGTLQSTDDIGAPRAYLNWLIFDRNYGFITGGFKQITTAARETGTDIPHERIFNPSPVQITQPGYVYIYLSNESTSLVEVFFDDFKVTHTKSPVIQQDDYYPFGLTFNSYHKENASENRFLFNGGSEHQIDLNLAYYSTLFRVYDPTIGRFIQLDPLADFLPGVNPYNFALNNPVLFADPSGLAPTFWQKLKAFFGIGRLSGTKVAGNQEYVKPVGKSNEGRRNDNPTPNQDQGSTILLSEVVVYGEKITNEDSNIGIESPSANIEPSKFILPKIQIPERSSLPERRRYRSGDEILGGIFVGTSTKFLYPEQAKKTFSDAYSSLILNPHLKVIIYATTNRTWSSDTGTEVQNSGGKTLREILNDRVNAIKNALIDLGVPESQIEFGDRHLYGDLDEIKRATFKLIFREK